MRSYQQYLEAKAAPDQLLQMAFGDIQRIFGEIRAKMQQKAPTSQFMAGQEQNRAAQQGIEQQLGGKRDPQSILAVLQRNGIQDVVGGLRSGQLADKVPAWMVDELRKYFKSMNIKTEAVDVGATDFLAQKEAEVKQILQRVYDKVSDVHRAGEEETAYAGASRALQSDKLALPMGKPREIARYNLIDLAKMLPLKGYRIYFKSPTSTKYNALPIAEGDPETGGGAGENVNDLIPLLVANRVVQIRDSRGKVIHRGLDIADSQEVKEFIQSHEGPEPEIAIRPASGEPIQLAQ